MKDKLTHILKRASEEIQKLRDKFTARIAANTNQIHRSYWALPPETRARLRLVIICVSILMLGIVIGLFVNVNRPVKLEKTAKTLSIENSGAMELKLPGVDLNPNIYIFQDAVKTQVPVELSVPGRLAFNAEKSKVLSARAPGRVERIYAFDGAPVEVGSPVVELYSPEFLSAQQEYLLSSKTAKVLEANKTMSDLLGDAQITQQAAANRMRNLGASDGDIKTLDKSGKTQYNLVMRSPLQGVVVKRSIEPGSIVNAGDVLVTLANPKELWFLGNVYEQDIRKIQKGQAMVLRSESYPDKEFIATANYIAPVIDPETHALLIRCDVENTDGLLRPDMYVSAKLKTGEAEAVVVPQSAIVRVREMRYVIIKTSKDTFRRFSVKGYDLDGKRFAVTEGLEPGMLVLTDGAVLLNDRFAKQEE
ncbi:efflux RND transporter periplasmic adaptor subunit [Polynucleobacter sp. AP-RePozz3-80-G7]|uniref:efflux RND transporter periplasmic adaptor subunit n=1 Tax=Polynucleobacter sp. AP-RePozz3-80-G7 TaxID=2689105 RepID=UPI001C0D0A7B|nr:efflux RND transporter periplasmic adaptor subunit [Polynucleobacter sp. AP-RePozz3-80-G7]MBU3638943.1 efflux RND transporter periplasmic adaptor subunit [Polynucleobacter sp. AP-RePozz3-80-G7]